MYSMIYSFPFYIAAAGTTGFCWRAGVRMPIIDSQLHKLILHADFMHSHILIDLLLLNAWSLACYKALRISNLELIGFLSGELYVVYCSRTGWYYTDK